MGSTNKSLQSLELFDDGEFTFGSSTIYLPTQLFNLGPTAAGQSSHVALVLFMVRYGTVRFEKCFREVFRCCGVPKRT